MKLSRCTLFLLLSLLSSESNAQQNHSIFLTGTVSTEEGLPVELANVALLTAGDSTFIQGTCTRPDGSFELSVATGREYILQVSYLGYRTLSKPITTGNVGHLVLEAETLALAEAVVTARRPVYKLKGNTLITSIPHTLLSTVGTAGDVLKHIPGVRLSEDNYSVFGKGTPLIYIDSHLIQNPSELDKLSSEEIEKVELITNPGAEYDATVKAVIRIRTIHRNSNGLSVDARSSLTQAKRTSHQEQLNVNYQKHKLSFFSSLYYFQQQVKRNQDVQYEIPSTSDWLINSHAAQLTKASMAYGKLGFGYDIAATHILGAAYEINRMPSNRSSDTSGYNVRENGMLTDETDYFSQSEQNGTTHQANAYYQGQVKELKIDFAADFVSRNNDTHQEANEVSQVAPPREITTTNQSDNTFYAAKLILTHPAGKGELKTGVDYTNIHRKDLFLTPQNLLPTTDSRIYEKNIAGFAEYSATFGKVHTSIGLRFEHATSNYWEKDIRIPEQSRTYNDWCPNFSLNLPIKEVQTSLTYSTKTNRPSFFQLRSSLNYNNRFVYEGGNPLLTPETIHDVSLMALYRWLQVSVSYKYQKNVLSFATRDHEPNPDVVIFSIDNFKKKQVISSYISLTPHFGWWKPELGIYFSKPFFQTNSMGEAITLNDPNAYFSWNNSLELTAGIVLSLDMDYQTRGNAGAMYLRPTGGVDVGIRKSFLNDALSINLQGRDLFASRRSSFMLYGSRLTYSKRSFTDSRQLSLTLRYKFNATATGYKGKRVSDKDIQRL